MLCLFFCVFNVFIFNSEVAFKPKHGTEAISCFKQKQLRVMYLNNLSWFLILGSHVSRTFSYFFLFLSGQCLLATGELRHVLHVCSARYSLAEDNEAVALKLKLRG